MTAESELPFDAQLAHRYFASNCFNLTWSLMERADRSSQEDEAMVLAATASLWHWTQRDDCTPQNLSIGHWQVSRVYALVGQGQNAMRHAIRSLQLAGGLSPFYEGYSYEAVARAASLLGDQSQFEAACGCATKLLAQITDDGERQALSDDLKSLTPPSPASTPPA